MSNMLTMCTIVNIRCCVASFAPHEQWVRRREQHGASQVFETREEVVGERHGTLLSACLDIVTSRVSLVVGLM
ncbi:hypothetical protein [Ensifer sp. ENS11]|uniref:hypothetical protein n=1 Tax=Ensifer sp. ENS11 TaxID=2769291 RepID=UPI001781D63C|nr:hypothetical protein [Ensifer sp. ENS11]MBD9488760.1 hypothetical protein [Ensifer sp. ENS11]